MNRKLIFLFVLLSILSLILGQTPSLAQTPLPPEKPESPTPSEDWKSIGSAPESSRDLQYIWSMPESRRHPLRTSQSSPQDTGGPDDFGYTWDDSVPYSWVISSNYQIGPSGRNSSLLVDIGFDFKFYENTYNQVYISTNGLLVFGGNHFGCCGIHPMPRPGPPNNVIAPYWYELAVGKDYNIGSVIYFNITSGTEQIFVVEWDNVTDCCNSGATDYKTFQVLLYDNGNILMQYADMNGDLSLASTGIEDNNGADGLQYPYAVTNNKAILFARPQPAARVQIFPRYYGTFTNVGSWASYSVPIRNIGELGVDTYDLISTSSWPVSLFASDGSTPLTDTDGDGIVDTGLLAQLESTTVVAKVKTPASAQVGEDNRAKLTVISSLDNTMSRTATLQSAVPTNFALAYLDDVDSAVSFLLVTPEKQTLKKPAGDVYYGWNMAISELPGFIYLWDKGYYWDIGPGIPIIWFDIEFTMLRENGTVIGGVRKLTDNSFVTMDTYDVEPVTAVTPDGHIGVAWRKYIFNDSDQMNANVYFAVLNASGDLISGPTNLTNNSTWGYVNNDNVPQFYGQKISASGDNRFIIAWDKLQYESGEPVEDIYYTVSDNDGSEVQPVTRFTFDTPGSDEAYLAPNLANLKSNRVLLTWERISGDAAETFYAVLNSVGDVIFPATNLTNDGAEWWDSASDAIQLSDGKILIAWESESSVSNATSQIRFAILNAAFDRISGPTALTNPATLTGDAYVSVTSDLHGNGVLTWMDYSSDYRKNLYYTLVNGKGDVLTEPMIFRSTILDQWNVYSIVSSFLGYGNTTYRSYDLVYDTFLPIAER